MEPGVRPEMQQRVERRSSPRFRRQRGCSQPSHRHRIEASGSSCRLDEPFYSSVQGRGDSGRRHNAVIIIGSSGETQPERDW